MRKLFVSLVFLLEMYCIGLLIMVNSWIIWTLAVCLILATVGCLIIRDKLYKRRFSDG